MKKLRTMQDIIGVWIQRGRLKKILIEAFPIRVYKDNVEELSIRHHNTNMESAMMLT